MKRVTLRGQFRAEMDCPKEVVMWNYYDHEHLVGTHYKLYDKARVLAERGNWSLVFRSKRMPLLPIYTSGIGFQYMDGNVMKIFQRWFWATWEEDAPMRLRRWKVHKLGFKDFSGVDYVNKKLAKPENTGFGKYEFDPPVKSSSPIRTPAGVERPFTQNTELGYKD